MKHFSLRIWPSMESWIVLEMFAIYCRVREPIIFEGLVPNIEKIVKLSVRGNMI